MMGQFYLEAASECKAEKSFLQLGMVSLRQVNSGKEEETRTRNLSLESCGYESRLAKPDQQPEASLAWRWGDPSCEA